MLTFLCHQWVEEEVEDSWSETKPEEESTTLVSIKDQGDAADRPEKGD